MRSQQFVNYVNVLNLVSSKSIEPSSFRCFTQVICQICVYMYKHQERRHIYFTFGDIWDTVYCGLVCALKKKTLIR